MRTGRLLRRFLRFKSTATGNPRGQEREGVLYVRLEVMGSWHPEGLEAPGVEVASFGVENGPLQNLGPVSEKSIFEPGHTVVESASLRNYFFRAD